jgi:heme/copper-type cytochrome/quinol oxidase subunit 2
MPNVTFETVLAMLLLAVLLGVAVTATVVVAKHRRAERRAIRGNGPRSVIDLSTRPGAPPHRK